MGSGGGGSAGAVDYPDYIKYIHRNLLDNGDWSEQVDELNVSVIEAMNTAYSNSPYASAVAYDPDTQLTAMAAQVTSFKTLVDALNYSVDFPAVVALASAQTTYETSSADTATLDSITIDETRLDDDIDAFDALLTAQLDDTELPKFKAGMLDIGATQSSAFTIGESILRAYKNREVTKYGTGIRVELQKSIDGYNVEFKKQYREIEARHRQIYRESERNFKLDRSRRMQLSISEILNQLMQKVEFTGKLSVISTDANRQHIIAKKEEISEQLEFDEHDARWYLDTFQYGTAVIAAVQGGVSHQPKRPSKAITALSGAFSGAAAGASTGASIGSGGGIYGAAIGAVAGAGLGYFSGS